MTRIACISLTTPDAESLAKFYETAFGFRRITSERPVGIVFEALMQETGGAKSISLQLGGEIIQLLEFDTPGRPYPPDFSASSLLFQHFAIVTQDMGEAYGRLCAVGGWSAITDPAPQHLPQSSGGVTAFKFRDPDGHPLELLEFPTAGAPEYWRRPSTAMSCQGIDHSAISVADTERSVAFYEKLGFVPVSFSINSGTNQSRLDHIDGVEVAVTRLTASNAAPHLELLRYEFPRRSDEASLKISDVAATVLVLEACGTKLGDADACRIIVDPDGHHLAIRG
jgi:catechol 2,3-dioxygenase-like lactoylglutathione lyase family enzyme